jgi:hypothetical protein
VVSGRFPLILCERHFLLRHRLGGLVDDVHGRGDGHDLGIEPARRLRRGGALLRLERIGVLALARHAIALGDHFGGLQHRHVDIGVHLQQVVVGAEPQFGGLHHRDRFDAACDHHVGAVDDDVRRRHRDRLQPGGALPIDRDPGDRRRQPRTQRCGPSDRRLHALRQRGPEHDVLDQIGLEPGALDGGADRVRGERRGRGRIERTAIGAPDRRARGGDDDGFTHDASFADERLDQA